MEQETYQAMPTREQFLAFLHAKWSDRACEICGTEDWNIVGSEDWPSSAVMAVNSENKTTGPFWPVNLLVCSNCQNTKSIFLLGVHAWINSEEGQEVLINMNNNLGKGEVDSE